MKQQNNLKLQDGWSSRLGFILAAVGSAVGLGNIWRFPYLMAENGGGVFIILYIGCILVLGIPILLVEFVIGSNGNKNQGNIIDILKEETTSKVYSKLAYIFLITLFIILSYYSVVAGWVFSYLFNSLIGLIDYNISDNTYYSEHFTSLLTNNVALIGSTFVMLLVTVFINIKGIAKGIEKVSIILMPLFFIILIIMVIRALTLENSEKGLTYIFSFDVNNFTIKNLLAALGQAFFSLSIGVAVMITYASYLKEKGNLVSSAVTTAGLDTVVGLLAGLIIIPALFAFSYDVNSGPGLAFIALPAIFSKLGFGVFFAFLFFLLLFIAAITSMISLLEPLIATIIHKFKFSRSKAGIVITSSIFFVSIFQALSFNVLADVKLFGMDLFSLSDFTTSNLLIPLGAMLSCIYLGFVLKEKAFLQLPHNGNSCCEILAKLWLGFIKFGAPVIIAIILLMALGIF